MVTPLKAPNQTHAELRGIIGTIAELTRATKDEKMVLTMHTQLAMILQTTGYRVHGMYLIFVIQGDVSKTIDFCIDETLPGKIDKNNPGKRTSSSDGKIPK